MQKGNQIEGGLVSREFLESTESVFDANSFGQSQKGAQQWYTPEKLAKFAFDLIGDRITVFDPTAGDGSLLKFFPTPHSFGVEIDPDQIEAAEGGYHAIQGDFQHVFPILREVGAEFSAITANPPFGLKWQIAGLLDDQERNSALVTLAALNRLLTYDGHFIFIAGRDRFYRSIADHPEARGIYGVLEIEELFEGTRTPCVVALGVNPEARQGEGFEKMPVTLEQLPLALEWAKTNREAACKWRPAYYDYNARTLTEQFTTLQKEHDRRRNERLGEGEPDYDVTLFGGDRIQVSLRAYATLVLNKLGKLDKVRALNGSSINYFIQAERDWNVLRDLALDGVLRIQPSVEEKVELALADVRKVLTPLMPMPPVMRLGFLSDIDHLLCIKSDPERGFDKGIRYDLATDSVIIKKTEHRTEQIKSGKRQGEWEDRVYTRFVPTMRIKVGHWSLTDGEEDAEDIAYLVDHFDIPDPGDVKTRYPEEYGKMRAIIEDIDENVVHPNSVAYAEKHGADLYPPVRMKEYQIDALARMLVKGDGMLALEQGLGKTLCGLVFAKAQIALGKQEAVLWISPQDLIAQTQREAERFLGIEFELLGTSTPKDAKGKTYKTAEGKPIKHYGFGKAKELARRLKDRSETGWYITYHEALATNGTRLSDKLEPVVVETRPVEKVLKGTDKYGHYKMVEHNGEQRQFECGWNDPEKVGYGWIPPVIELGEKIITSNEVCPECRATRTQGWNGRTCERKNPTTGKVCGYVHFSVKVKPMGSILSTAFRNGVVIADESTSFQAKADSESQRSKVMRGIKGGARLAMTGTPIKNYIEQAFWPMWWALGNDTPRFGYDYDNGMTKFQKNFCVFESYTVRGDNKKLGMKSIAQVANLSLFWRLTGSGIIRLRKEDTGETLPPLYYFETYTPLGKNQLRQQNKWVKKFPEFFAERYPDAPVVKAGMHETMAPMLGLNVKLEYAELLPEIDPDSEWVDAAGLYEGIEVSNWTPATLKTLELTMALAKQGKKVVVGCPFTLTSEFLAEALVEKGVNAAHILDAGGQTLNPKARSKVIGEFQNTDDLQVICTGVKAIRYGHNLSTATAMVLLGVDWDYETMSQFVARIHRLTSPEPVAVYIVIPGTENQETMSVRKWKLLGMKGGTAELALDGKIVKKNEEKITQADVIRELMQKGITETGEEIEESEVKKAWDALPSFAEYEVPEGLLRPTPRFIIDPTAYPIAAGPLDQQTHDAVVAVADFLHAAAQAAATPAVETETPSEDAQSLDVVSSGESEVFGEDDEPQDEPEREPEAEPEVEAEPEAEDDEAEPGEEPEAAPSDDVMAALAEMRAEMERMQARLEEVEAENERLKTEPTQLELIA